MLNSKKLSSSALLKQLLAFLSNPRSYPHRPGRVRLLQTHSSLVFIASPFVFKVKLPVNFGFLDFSTLEKRRYFCEREVALNRRMCPKVYLGVEALSLHNGRIQWGGGGEVVEYVVKMRKLSKNRFLDRLVALGRVVEDDIDRIAAVLKAFYEIQKPTEEVESWGKISRLRISTEENFRQTSRFVGHTLSRPAFEALHFYTEKFYHRHKSLFALRIKEHRILDCHGDLHLEHIHITARALQIYDCIEFNDRFRYVDVANDAAFLAMDLDYEGRPDLARHFAARMASVLSDDGMPRLMDFYKSYRAYVRGKVESLHSISKTAPEPERLAAALRARRYFRLSLRYSVAGSDPLVLVVMGGIGSGKSALAHAMGAELGWDVYSSDRVRKELAGVPLFERSSSQVRRHLYATERTNETYDRLLALAVARVQEGNSVILDATFSRRGHRQRLTRALEKRGIQWRFIEAQASASAVRRRLNARGAEAGELSDARIEDFEALMRMYESPDELSPGQCVKVRTMGFLDAAVTTALKKLAIAAMDCARQLC